MMWFKVLQLYIHLAPKAILGNKQQRDAASGTYDTEWLEVCINPADWVQDRRLPFMYRITNDYKMGMSLIPNNGRTRKSTVGRP